MSNDNCLNLINEFREGLTDKVSSSVAELVTDELIKLDCFLIILYRLDGD